MAPDQIPTNSLPSPTLTSLKMDRQDSGYASSPAALPTTTTSSRRSSASYSSRRHLRTQSSQPKPKRRTTTTSTSTTPCPFTKRTSRPFTEPRPHLSTRHTTPSQPSQQAYEFFQFPVLASPPSPPQQPAEPPPPATVQYWTSDSTRRLEYAAIDAASTGIRGFFVKLLPDCILPKDVRKSGRGRFHCEDGESDAGSVRRYRLVLEDDKEMSQIKDCGLERAKRPGGLARRWTSFGRRRSEEM